MSFWKSRGTGIQCVSNLPEKEEKNELQRINEREINYLRNEINTQDRLIADEYILK